MRVLYAVLCEDAAPRDDGRLDVHGVFHQLYAPGFPARQDRLTIAVALEWAPEERGEIDFSINLLDPGQSPVLTINGGTEVGDQPGAAGPPMTRVVLPLQGVVFPRPGTYEFELTVGERKELLAPLHLIENPESR